MKKVAILQSNYIPWKGYFDIINQVDEFIFYDTEQYTKRDWRNRNKVKGPNGVIWLSVPVQVKGKYFQRINETLVDGSGWRKNHWASIKMFYSKANYFKFYREIFEELYLNSNQKFLSKINFDFIKAINEILEIDTKLRWSEDFEISGEKSEKLLSICQAANAKVYVTGPAAKGYFDESLFNKEKINVFWMDYSNYPEYSQLFPPFEHRVSILDLIFNEGPNAPNYMKSFSK
jgi:hypothetical protein